MADQVAPPAVPVLPAVFTDTAQSAALAEELLGEVVGELAFEYRFIDFGGRLSTQRPIVRAGSAEVAVCEAGRVVVAEQPTVLLPADKVGLHVVVDAANMLSWSPDLRRGMVVGLAEGVAGVLWDKLTEMLHLVEARPSVAAAEAHITQGMGPGTCQVGVLANGIEVVYDDRAIALVLLPERGARAWLEEGEEDPGWHLKLHFSFAAGLITTGACRLYAVGPGPTSS